MFGETRYAAKSWGRTRRVIMKAEVVQYPGRAPRDNPRFVVSNLTLAPEAVYAVYRQRTRWPEERGQLVRPRPRLSLSSL